MLDLNDQLGPNSEWTLTGALGINNKGQILAFGSNGSTVPGPSGTAFPDTRLVVLTPDGSPAPHGTPEPGSLTLVSLALLSVAGYRWRLHGKR